MRELHFTTIIYLYNLFIYLYNQFTIFFFCFQIEIMCKKYGSTNAYNYTEVCHGIIDKFITREFCQQISWSGRARAQNVKSKLNFSSFRHVINAFNAAVCKSAHNATEIEIQEFFKNTIFRNSTARLHHIKYKINTGKECPKKRKRNQQPEPKNENQQIEEHDMGEHDMGEQQNAIEENINHEEDITPDELAGE